MVVVAAVVRYVQHAAELARSHAFRREIARTLVAWGVLFAVGIWMVVCQQWSDMRWVRRLPAGPGGARAAAPWPAAALLQDQVLEHLPQLERAWISDKLVGTSVIGSIVGCSLLARGWRARLMLVRRIAWMVAVLYFVRSVTISVTTVPPSTGACEIGPPQSTWQVIKATPDILAGTVGQCTDKIFSGHTAILTISFLFWCRYATHWGFIAYSAVHTALGVLTVLMARYHYTVDVVLGLLLTYGVHHTYYAALLQAVAARQADARDETDSAGLLMYDMAVLAKAEDSWDRDSALGVEVGRRADEQLVRKREPQSAASSLAASSAASSDAGDAAHHEIDVADHHPLPGCAYTPAWMHAEQQRLLALGINRPFGAVLPTVVAWMDGLDIRTNC
ncbi:hypothetical protein LPJ70_006983 [Coemansia sp. RSA 2708]|nr:hypothetical protein LPJ70_006983 [Coemansia sp. RSA 2708]KAJ2309526.1 hypothetical protein IWW54_003684 [Coemansia sp. RSA 2705]KAJ2366134.1 hypothetical protein H4S01_002874 [Coemansia sp. RSA 2610]